MFLSTGQVRELFAPLCLPAAPVQTGSKMAGSAEVRGSQKKLS
jgi:hypothetical protein